jgi:hypothetical protein
VACLSKEGGIFLKKNDLLLPHQMTTLFIALKKTKRRNFVLNWVDGSKTCFVFAF